jgi:gas vesicle protein
MKTTLALVAGIAAGVCIGLLIAPDKGSETRKKLAETTGDWADKLMNLFNRESDTEGSNTKRPRPHGRTSGQPQA